MNDRLDLPADTDPPATADRLARHEMARALAHPRLTALMPLANGALAIGLGAYTLAYLAVIFSVVFSR